MRMRIFAIACCAAGLMFPCFSSCTTKTPTALNEGQLSQYVGSIQGHCCKPGKRYGCAVENFSSLPITCSKNTTSCPGDMVMDCTSASCQAAEPSDTCNYTPKLVGRNRCKFTKQNCGTEQECTTTYAPIWGPWYPCGPGVSCRDIIGYEAQQNCVNVNKFECIPSLQLSWRDDANPVPASVCDGGTTCTTDYSRCEG